MSPKGPTHSHPSDLEEGAGASVVDLQVSPRYQALVPTNLLLAAVEATLRQQNAWGELALVISDDDALQQLNRDFLDIDSPTDVLAFPAQERADRSTPFVSAPEAVTYLGDVILSFPAASRQAQAAGHPVAHELSLLAVHGTLHLLGHDHTTPEEKAAMWSAQAHVLAGFGITLDGNPEEEQDVSPANQPAPLKSRSRWHSFTCAVAGIAYTLRTQRNTWIELAAASVVTMAGIWLKISAAEWAILALTVSLILALEAVNSAVEALVDLASPGYHDLARIAKDCAAGAMLLTVIGTLGVAAAIFGPRLLALLNQ